MQAAEALLVGFLGAILLVTLGGFLFVLWRVDGRLKRIQELIAQLAPVLEASKPLVLALVRTSQTMNQTTEAIRGLSDLMVAGDRQPAPRPEWRHPSPPNPAFDIPAPPGEAGYLEQTDEELAEIERIAELREQGIEASPDRIPVPDFNLIRGDEGNHA
jgi:hypothetical protein